MSAVSDLTSQHAAAAGTAEVARSQARLAAVQALYQMDLASTDLTKLIAEFAAHRFGEEVEDRTVADADLELFSEIVRGVVERQRDIDMPLDAQLAAGWRLNRIDSIIRATLRSAMFELLGRPEGPRPRRDQRIRRSRQGVLHRRRAQGRQRRAGQGGTESKAERVRQGRGEEGKDES